MVFEVSQSLALVKQPIGIGHMWRIIIGHTTLPTIHLLIYKKNDIEEWLIPNFKVIERYYKNA